MSDDQAVHLSGDVDRVAVGARNAADDRHFGTAARREYFGKVRRIENGEHLPRNFGLLGGRIILCGISEISLGGVLAVRRRNIGQRLHQPMHDPPAFKRLLPLGGGSCRVRGAADLFLKGGRRR